MFLEVDSEPKIQICNGLYGWYSIKYSTALSGHILEGIWAAFFHALMQGIL